MTTSQAQYLLRVMLEVAEAVAGDARCRNSDYAGMETFRLLSDENAKAVAKEFTRLENEE